MTCPIEPLVDNGSGMGIKNLFSRPFFWVAICLMICSGASELAMAQWASAYAESALGLSKALGDLTGPCMFAVTMGISRIIFGKYGEQLDLMKFMGGSGILCVVCYLLAALSSSPIIGLYRLYCMWIFSWNHVAGNNQYFFENFSKRWNSYVLSPCHGRRFRRQYRTRNRWPYHSEF